MHTDPLCLSLLEQLRQHVCAVERGLLRPIIEAEIRAEIDADMKRLGSQTLSHKKAAQYLGVSTTTLDRLRHNRANKFPKPIDIAGSGSKPAWLRSELDEWLVMSRTLDIMKLDRTSMPMTAGNLEYEDVHDAIKSACDDCGLTAERIDDIQSNDRITDQLLKSIRRAEFVIADLTASRPNVFYEAGYAQALEKTPIYVARQGTVVEFDVKDFPVIFFENMRQLKEKLVKRLHGIGAARSGETESTEA